jgi:hypothetical protein
MDELVIAMVEFWEGTNFLESRGTGSVQTPRFILTVLT